MVTSGYRAPHLLHLDLATKPDARKSSSRSACMPQHDDRSRGPEEAGVIIANAAGCCR